MGGAGRARNRPRSVLTRLNGARIEDLFQSGLHEFITGFLNDNAKLGSAIAEQYLV